MSPDIRTIEQMWADGRRAFVKECLERNEHPYNGWDKDYPDLAEQRRKEVSQ